MDTEALRKEFEEWRDNKFCKRDDPGEYRDVFTQEAWIAWLESARRADKRIKELEDRLFTLGAMNEPPCFCCGYRGPGYYQAEKHKCAERHHKLAMDE